MATTMDTTYAARRAGPHPIHAILLGFPIALFTIAVITDVAYLRSAEIQWTNFSAWLITGALVFGALVAIWAVVDAVVGLKAPGRGRRVLYAGVLAVMWALGFINAFKHSQDAWTSVGAFGLGLSILSMLLALAAGWLAFSGWREASR